MTSLTAHLNLPTQPGGEPARPNLRKLAKDRTRQKVLTAALLEFKQAGYEDATIRSIAARAGMSTGAIYANWPDKADLYRELFGHPPITPEGGKRLLAMLSNLQAVRPSNWREDPLSETLRGSAAGLLGELAGDVRP